MGPPPLSGEVVFEAPRGDQQIEGAVVELLVDGRVAGEAVTDAEGSYRFREVPAGPFDLRVSKGGDYEDYHHPEPLDPATFSRGTKYLVIRLEGHQTVLKGKVVDDQGGPVEGASVRTYPGTAVVQTNSDGEFELASGQFESVGYRVQVSLAGYKDAFSNKITPTMGEENLIEMITLEAYTLSTTGTEGGDLDTSGSTGEGKVTQGNQ